MEKLGVPISTTNLILSTQFSLTEQDISVRECDSMQPKTLNHDNTYLLR